MKLITLDQWDAAPDPERQKLLDEGAILSQEDMDRLSLRLKARAPHWEDDYCGKCDHHDRYHFQDGQGKVFCRWDGKCVCAESAAAVPADSTGCEL